MNLFDKAQGAALDLAMNYVLKDPACNLSHLLDVVEALDIANEHVRQLQVVRPIAEDPDNPWNQFVVKLCQKIDHDVLKAAVCNFFFDASVLGMRKQAESREKYNCNILWATLMDSTSVNANGDYEPCAFIYYSDTNFRTHTLLEVLQAPLFTAYREGQPWNDNHLRPCPLLDDPEKLVEAVERSGAHCTDLQSPEDVRKLAGKCEEKAEAWAEVADEIWTCFYNCTGCQGGCAKGA